MSAQAIEAACIGYHGAYFWNGVTEDDREFERRHFRAAIASYDAALWQPIESAPKDVELILGWHGCDAMANSIWYTEIGLSGHENDKPPGMSNGWLHGRATHWRPLPQPPEAAR